MIPWPQRILAGLRPTPAWWALLAAIGLSVMGVSAISSIPAMSGQGNLAPAQIRWLIIGLIVMLACLVPGAKHIGLSAFPLTVAISIVLALIVLPFMPESIVPVRNGTRAWINLRFMSLQPSELAKIIFVLALARYLRYRENYRTLGGLLVPFAIMFVPVILILKEPDMGTAMLFGPVLFATLVAAGARMKHMGLLAGLAVLVVILSVASIYLLPDSMQILRAHQRDRIKVMIDMAQGGSRYAQDVGYQQDKAMMLVGAGQAGGFGAERSSTILRFNPLPEAHNDMIFAVIVNRWGFAGGALVLGLFAMLIGSFLTVAAQHKDPFARLSIVGFAALLMTQVTINIGMTLGLLPVIGITLPFVSYGGSSMLTVFIMLGLVLNFAAERPAMLTRPSFEFDRADALLREVR